MNQLPLVLAGLKTHPFVSAFPSLCHLPVPVAPPYVSKIQNQKRYAHKPCLRFCFNTFRIIEKGALGSLVLKWLLEVG